MNTETCEELAKIRRDLHSITEHILTFLEKTEGEKDENDKSNPEKFLFLYSARANLLEEYVNHEKYPDNSSDRDTLSVSLGIGGLIMNTLKALYAQFHKDVIFGSLLIDLQEQYIDELEGIMGKSFDELLVSYLLSKKSMTESDTNG